MTRTELRSVRRGSRPPERTRRRRPRGPPRSARPPRWRREGRAGSAPWRAGPRRAGPPGRARGIRTPTRGRPRGWKRRSFAHQLAEVLEEAGGVVRTGRGLGVVLDAERGSVEQPEPLDHPVVEVDVPALGAAVRGVERSVQRRLHGEAVVVAGDVNPAGGALLHGLVDPAVAEPQLVGAQAERAAELLVAL